MNCQDAKNLLWDMIEGTLADDVRAGLDAHLASCADCAREAAICRQVDSALAPQAILKAPDAAVARAMAQVASLAAERRAELEREPRVSPFAPFMAYVTIAAALRNGARAAFADRAAAARNAVLAAVTLVVIALGVSGVLPSQAPGAPTLAGRAFAKVSAAFSSVRPEAAARAYVDSVTSYGRTYSAPITDSVSTGSYYVWFFVAGAIVLILIFAAALEEAHLRRRLQTHYRQILG